MFAVLTESASRFNSALFLKPNLMLPERMLSTQLGKNLPFAAVDLLHVTFSFFFFSLPSSFQLWLLDPSDREICFELQVQVCMTWLWNHFYPLLHFPPPHSREFKYASKNTTTANKKHKWELYCNKLQLFRSYLKAKPVEHRPPPSKYTAGHSIGTGFKGIAPPTEPLLQLPAFHPGNSLDQLLTKTTAFAK